MMPYFKEQVWLILDNLGTGVALLDENYMPLLYNAIFVQNCKNFQNQGSKKKDALVIPDALLKKVRESEKFVNECNLLERRTYQLISPLNELFFLTVKPVPFHGRIFFFLSFNKKRLREEELFKILEEEYKITKREFEVIMFVKKGMKNKEIASLMKTKEPTIKAYLRNVFVKLDVSTRTELIGFIDDLTE